ncbi:MAG TPA: NAD(P)/FAD-dependent oxidoreductase [Aquabacterium sp.]|uniref:flavin monoamine oxidase family protein n=1 Tax=Aquabacterium sp. TaxID=1872578 RepID=UPI002E32D12F|nr:NAD(P)/FAD-dependent oxidoreductase [Aquabacterium sp.]HEX5373876.1 NAD(P)/FAD-dependent oxidoreductase [Aquabacterium sp.]
MIDVAIVGAGLTGLALAHRLHAMGLSVRVLEARERVGGRMLTRHAPTHGASVDMGATWHWPESEPHIAALIETLGLHRFEQPDEGRVLHLSDPQRGPEDADLKHVHQGARRVSGGMERLAQALLGLLPAGAVRLGCPVEAVVDHPDHLLVRCASSEGSEAPLAVRARHVVLAMPPRLVAQHLRFDPPLPDETMTALRATPTWMAREAKAVARFDRPVWHDNGCSGTAFVGHHQALLREVWDASDVSGAALAGFVALEPTQRRQFSRGMSLLVSSQLAQLFGMAAQSDDQEWMDWACERWTCSDQDREDAGVHPGLCDPVLRRPHWAGRLYFGGSETARHGAGHMEGALDSAARLADLLRPVHGALAPRQGPGATQLFHDWVAVRRGDAIGLYRQHLTRLLSRQEGDQLTQRALLHAVEQVYTQALSQLAAQDHGMAASADEPAHRAQVQALLNAFTGFSKTLVDEALDFNARSCALSNFPEEHRPSGPYLQAITADLAAAWREFAWSVHDLLQARRRQAA